MEAKAATQIGRRFPVAGQAEGAEVVEIALAAAFGDWKDVIGVPQGPAGSDGLHAPDGEGFHTRFAAAALERCVGRDGVRATGLTDATVAGEDQIAKVARV